jgi:hypothetical protein
MRLAYSQNCSLSPRGTSGEGGVRARLAGAPPLPGPTAIELRSADFSPLPYRPGETGGGGLKSALLLARTAPNSTAVLPGPPAGEEREERQRRRVTSGRMPAAMLNRYRLDSLIQSPL